MAEDTALFLKYISEIVFNPRLDSKKLEEERQRVLREIADAKSKQRLEEYRAYYEAFYGKNSPHLYSILGSETVISSVSREGLKNFHQRGYHPNNANLILVGALPKNIETIIQDNFGRLQPAEVKKIDFSRNPPLEGATIFYTAAPELLNEEHPEESSANLEMSLFAPIETDEDSYSTEVLIRILGENRGSRLFKNISQRKGLAYSIGAKYDRTNKSSVITVSGKIKAKRADEAISAIFEEMKKLQTDPITEDELKKIKRNSQYTLAKLFETNAGHVHAIELKQEYGLTPEIFMMEIETVTTEKVREAAVKYLPSGRIDGKYALWLRNPLMK